MKRTFLFLAFVLGLSAAQAQIAGFPNDITRYLNGKNQWGFPSVVSNTTMAGSLKATQTTLTAASAVTNYTINMTTGLCGLINMTTDVNISTLTGTAAGSRYLLLIVNTSGTNYTVAAYPTTSFASGYAAANDLPTTLTNGTAASIEVFGYGTTTNAVLRFTRYTK